MLKKMIASPKTTSAGVTSVITGIGLIMNKQYIEGIAALSTGIGLLFACDISKKDTSTN